MSAPDTLIQRTAPPATLLAPEAIRESLEAALGGRYCGARLLVLIPDHTRTMPMPMLFRMLTQILAETRQLDFMVALGTHPPLSEESLCRLVGISAEERRGQYAHIGLLNHAWDNPAALARIGTLERAAVQHIAGEGWHPSLGGDVPIRINRLALEYDHLLILGPTFPHEVVGFSGGAKYLFPGISGEELINVTHWLGALITVRDTIGIMHTPMRAMIHRATEMLPTPVSLIALVVEKDGLSGLFAGGWREAWEAAAAFSSERHIVWLDQPFQRVLSHAPTMYDELWVAAKAMYKLDPAVADGGEIVIYAPHLRTVSHVHGHHLARIGYHVRDYFLQQWAQFRDVPLGVLAHSTHVKGTGRYANGIEAPRIRVTLASQIPEAECRAINLGYADPERIDPATWRGREAEGVAYIPKAGEMLYRVRQER